MAQEIEGKFRVASHETVRIRLREAGAERLGLVVETNHIFDDAARSMLASDCGLRVRALEVLDGVARPSTVTYKGRRTGGAFKRREEIETTVGDPSAMCALLARLGFVEALCYQKRRESWRLDRCEVDLDDLPHLGLFVEIEGPDEAAIEAARLALGLTGEPVIHASYIALLIAHCRERGLDTTRILLGR